MRRSFVVVSALSLLAFALQFVFAAVGAFTKPADDDAYVLHSLTGMAVIPLLTLLTVLFAALARAPGRVIGLSVLPLGLVILQALIAGLAKGFTDAAGASTPVSLTIGGLHAVNGIIAVHVAAAVAKAARELARPGGEGDRPGTEGDRLPAKGNLRTLELDLPGGGVDRPAGGADRPAGGADRPAGGADRPAGRDGRPSRAVGSA